MSTESPPTATPPARSYPAFTRRNMLLVSAALLLFVALAAALSLTLDETTGVDWYVSFRPATLRLLQFQSPYLELYRNPPWALIPLIPLAILPPNVGRAAFLILSLAAFVVIAVRLGAKPLTLLVFLLSPPVLHSLLNANNDSLALLGFILPPQIGLFFLLIKPQIGIAAIIYWLFESWRRGGVREVFRVFWPLTVATLLSFVVFGFWPRSIEGATDLWWNASLWPASIPVGLALLVASIRTRKIEYAMGAAPCLSPYVLLHAWSGALAALMRRPAEMLAAVIGLWLVILIRLGVLPF